MWLLVVRWGGKCGRGKEGSVDEIFIRKDSEFITVIYLLFTKEEAYLVSGFGQNIRVINF